MKSYKPNFIIIIFIILLILASISIFIYFNYPKLFKTKNPIPLLNEDSVLTPKKEIISEENQKGMEDKKMAEELKLQEQTAEIIKTNNYNECDKIEDAMYKKVCINNIALKLAEETLDISHCQKLDNELIPRDDCERRVVLVKSINDENIGICDQAQDEKLIKQCKEDFYPTLSIKKSDINICEKENDKKNKNNCYNYYFLNKEFNQKIKEFNCNKIQGDNEIKDCQKLKFSLIPENFDNKEGNLSTLLGFNNPSLCQGLKTDIFIYYCYSLFMPE